MAKPPRKTKKARGKVGRPKGSGVKGHVQTLLQLRPDQRAALLELAEARRVPGRPPPLSEVARDLLDKALARKKDRT
ncbi:hypothetical protein [Anaeromyxobacter paludicola]|uniref:Uncharacterized protein n=1 Tax=Anaeromyxobacter paludicola TaxID=2918171 RepID=A0ABM7X5A1_9BACT|nr:hypothetical protein [Anaeromyxobacter paludicola]BDG06993.1 hypothetical protein AMPC_01060 [Anaeromyxobacter paludicola]